jgi:hypothetical protein
MKKLLIILIFTTSCVSLKSTNGLRPEHKYKAEVSQEDVNKKKFKDFLFWGSIAFFGSMGLTWNTQTL